MKFLKQIIAIVFLAGSIWLGYLVFQNEFSTATVVYDTQYELQDTSIGTLTRLIRGTVFTGLGISFLGMLALFTNFVFVKLLFKEHIKTVALKYLKEKRKQINKLVTKDTDDSDDDNFKKTEKTDFDDDVDDDINDY